MRIAVAGSSGLIGAQLSHLARAAGHAVVPLSRTDGVDLLDAGALAAVMQGVEAVVDVSRPTQMDLGAARDFFTTVAKNLAAAGRRCGVRRSVVLSIVGVDRGQDYDWYVATLAHEEATREYAPGARVLRSTLFHEFPGQVLERALGDSEQSASVQIMDVPIQPVESIEVARALLDLATDPDAGDRQLAGPRVERLVDLVSDLVAHDGLDVEVLPGPASVSMAGGSMLPDADVITAGVDWHTWLQRRGRSDWAADNR
ncbi:MAG TPA: NAD-dependent epimerase/dehydratase family protein [Intrasporangium sp.]|nr:NAD-dependent epimerase/dehydratase family protein [Intrasporangium sp.]